MNKNYEDRPVRPLSQTYYRDGVKYHEQRIEGMKVVAASLDDDMLVKIGDKINEANNVFVAALGRSRLNIMAFATRLCQLGISAHVVGDNSTPSIHRGDLFIIGSSSGRTSSLVEFAKKAKAVDAEIVLFTEAAESPIGDLSTLVYHLTADESKLPEGLGWYAEYGINLCYESLVMYLQKKRGVTNEEMQDKLANLY
ncbi:MAG: SIS domain-containing protein [Clostridia bacterium]|nr:SIS domain-containing protein [Clostridia bacterium]